MPSNASNSMLSFLGEGVETRRLKTCGTDSLYVDMSYERVTGRTNKLWRWGTLGQNG